MIVAEYYDGGASSILGARLEGPEAARASKTEGFAPK